MSTGPTYGPVATLSERVTMWLARAGSVGLAFMMFLTLADVVGRAFDHPIVGTVEVTELVMGMMIYLAVGYTTFLRGHIRVDIIILRLSVRWQAALDIITVVIGIVFAGLISWHLFGVAISRVTNNDLTQIYELPVWPAAFVMAISSVLLFTSLFYQLYLAIYALATGVQIAGPAGMMSDIKG